MKRLTNIKYPEMTLEFCTEVDCLARDFCPGLQKHNRLFEYEETGLTPEAIKNCITVLRQRHTDSKGVERAIYGEVLDMLGAALDRKED